MATRKIDSEALREYLDKIKPELDRARDELAPMLEQEGALGKMPGFGVLDNASVARGNYEDFHQTMWTHTQKLVESLQGLYDAVEASAGLSDESDTQSAADLDNQIQE